MIKNKIAYKYSKRNFVNMHKLLLFLFLGLNALHAEDEVLDEGQMPVIDCCCPRCPPGPQGPRGPSFINTYIASYDPSTGVAVNVNPEDFIPFSTLEAGSGIDYDGINKFTITRDGVYQVTFGVITGELTLESGPGSFALLLNGTAVPGGTLLLPQLSPVLNQVSVTVIFSAKALDTIQVQNNTTSTISLGTAVANTNAPRDYISILQIH